MPLNGIQPYEDVAFDPFVGIQDGSFAEHVSNTPSNTTSDNVPAQSVEPEPTLAQYFVDHPDATYEEAMKYMSTHSEEWAEKYLDYLTERGELDRANQYTAEREDTAYQRLMNDLQRAGLNPALMYGGSASISAGGSQGYIKMTEGANSRAVGNYSKIQKVLLAYMLYELQKNLGIANSVFKGIGSIGSILGAVL